MFITLQPPTEPMRQEALSAGIYTPEHFPDRRHPRVHILTIDELLDGVGVAYSRGRAPATFWQVPWIIDTGPCIRLDCPHAEALDKVPPLL